MYKLGQLSQEITAELIGDPNAEVDRARPFDTAGDRDITFAATRACLEQLDRSRATVVIVKHAPPSPATNLLVAPDPKLAFARAVSLLHTKRRVLIGVS